MNIEIHAKLLADALKKQSVQVKGLIHFSRYTATVGWSATAIHEGRYHTDLPYRQLIPLLDKGYAPHNLPARPFLTVSRKIVQERGAQWTKVYLNAVNPVTTYTRIIESMVGVLRKEILGKGLSYAPNAPSTLRKKKGDIPLVDTKEMVNALQTSLSNRRTL